MAVVVRSQAANVLTATRVVLTPVFAAAVWRAGEVRGWGAGAAVVFLLIAASDVCDGRVARRCGAASRGGRVFDHGADLCFLLTALTTYVSLGVTPWWVPTMIGLSFGAYVFDARRQPASSANVIASKLGHVGGVGNYVLVGVLVFDVSLGLRWLPAAALAALYATVAVYSAGAVVARVLERGAAPPVALPTPRD
jgi:phosphatidylglycerophosphate synthase